MPPENLQLPAPVIGIYSSFPGQGKSVVAERLVEKHGFRLLKFARVPKKMIAYFLIEHGYPETRAWELIERDKDEVLERVSGTPTTRYLLQTLGTQWGRHEVHGDVWANEWMLKAGVWSRSGTPVVADDMRFPNEVAVVRQLGGFIWRVERPDASYDPSVVKHESEGRLNTIKFDVNLINDGTIGKLHNKIDPLVARNRKGAKGRRKVTNVVV